VLSIAQCNNSYIFPGIGLGVIASGAKRVTDKMFMVASETLAEYSPQGMGEGNDLLPDLKDLRKVSKMIAFAVGMQAIQESVAETVNREMLEKAIETNFWNPEYRHYRRISF
jgi:malate dehydrogenase (oxaloacetate-decarboxylating)